jgi:hypothetical protein
MSKAKIYHHRVETLEKLVENGQINDIDYQTLDTAAQVEAGLLTFNEVLRESRLAHEHSRGTGMVRLNII